MTRRPLWRPVLLGWAIVAVILVAATYTSIIRLDFVDPDDAMRLVEVRDWLGGQSWWDVGQHRLNGGAFSMHWSRLVDIPLAAVILIFSPLVGSAAATQIAVTAIPLLGVLLIMALGVELTRRLSDRDHAVLVALIAPLSIALLFQFRPTRIDHHGWQMICALAAVTALFGKVSVRSGLVAGAMLAGLLTISMEGLPITAAIVGAAALAWAFDPDRRGQVLALAWSLFMAVVILHAATRGPGMFTAACDAIAPVWIAALGVAAIGITVVTRIRASSVALRISLLAIAGIAAIAVLPVLAPQCLRGPFSTLDPLVYRLWYLEVTEGLPIWHQPLLVALLYLGQPVAGLVGGALAIRACSGESRRAWIMMTGIAAASLVLAVFVTRAGSMANVMALPGSAWLFHLLLVRARRISTPVTRVFATTGALAAASPGIVAVLLLTLWPRSTAAAAASNEPVCATPRDTAALDRIPPATLFAPLDITPELLAVTHHRAIAAGYHRNDAAMHRVIAAFIGTPETAQQIIARSGADYIAVCPGTHELTKFKTVAPNGFWAQLNRGVRFPWLKPVPMKGSPVRVWRVIDRPM